MLNEQEYEVHANSILENINKAHMDIEKDIKRGSISYAQMKGKTLKDVFNITKLDNGELIEDDKTYIF